MSADSTMLIGLNPVPPQVFPVNCQTCHSFPHAGSDVGAPAAARSGCRRSGDTATSFNGPLAVQNVGFGAGPPPANDHAEVQVYLHQWGYPSVLRYADHHQRSLARDLITGKCCRSRPADCSTIAGAGCTGTILPRRFGQVISADCGRLLQPALRDEPDGPGKDRSGQFLVRTLVDDRR